VSYDVFRDWAVCDKVLCCVRRMTLGVMTCSVTGQCVIKCCVVCLGRLCEL